MSLPRESTYLGFDLSTQKLKVVQINSNFDIVKYADVEFDKDLPEFCTSGGVNKGKDANEYYVQPIMWIKALDIVLNRLVINGADLKTVTSISGSAQQHGSIFWSKFGVEKLKNLKVDQFLHEQFNETDFQSPVWMDSSTENECKEMENLVGGSDIMFKITGSKCYPRFTGPQIRKIFKTKRESYENTERISLISSFLASLLIQDIAPIDFSDACGMNLFDINNKKWSCECLNACAPLLQNKLGKPIKTSTIIGNIGNFFVQRYKFMENCKICAFTGDNPSAVSGMLLLKDWIAVSLGTSDTIMMTLKKPFKIKEGHIFCHPTSENDFISLLCYSFRNGSLIRDIFRKNEASNDWNIFSNFLNSTPPGNRGNMALHFDALEIIPHVKGVLKWTKMNSLKNPNGIKRYSTSQEEVRALIEGQMLHHKAMALDVGLSNEKNIKILATGGGSSNKEILQVMADIFGFPVYIQKTKESALMGAAYRAVYILFLSTNTEKLQLRFEEFIRKYLINCFEKVCEPQKDTENVYLPMLQRYHEMIKILKEKFD